MIFLLVMGILFLILGGFYLANSWMRYHEWKGGTIIVVLSVIAIIYGGVGMVREHNAPSQSASSSQSSSQSTTTQHTVTQQEQKEDYALRQLQKTYAKFGDVNFNSKTKTFVITPTSDNAKQAMNDIVQNPGNASQDGWDNVSKSVKSGSKQLVKLLGHGYRMEMVQPDHKDKAMLIVKDGHTLYDISNTGNSSSSSNQ